MSARRSQSSRAMSAAQDLTGRSAEYVDELAAQGRQLAGEVDRQLERYTGRSSDAWLAQASRMIARHPWKALGVAVVVAYVWGKLRA